MQITNQLSEWSGEKTKFFEDNIHTNIVHIVCWIKIILLDSTPFKISLKCMDILTLYLFLLTSDNMLELLKSNLWL